MFYVDFIGDSPGMIVNSKTAGIDVREFVNKAAFSALYPDFPVDLPIDTELNQFKREAEADLKRLIADAQHKIIGETDPARQERFKVNARISRAVLVNTASAIEREALQLQLDANKRLDKNYANVSLMAFAGWIVQQDELATAAAGRLEVTHLECRAAIRNAKNRGQVLNAMNDAASRLAS